jgi:alkylation response protein AidB-like acyl-CoA dehydrogenase
MSPFCETFFDNARALKKNVVGEVNKGWTVAKRLLQYERTSIGGIGGGTQQAAKIEDVAKDYLGVDDGRIADSATRQRVIAHRMNDRSFGLTMRRSMEESQSGRAPGAASSMFKYYGTEQNIRRYELLLSIMGTQAVGWSGDSFSSDELTTTRAWLRSKANSIEGGTSEVQLNILETGARHRTAGLQDKKKSAGCLQQALLNSPRLAQPQSVRRITTRRLARPRVSLLQRIISLALYEFSPLDGGTP